METIIRIVMWIISMMVSFLTGKYLDIKAKENNDLTDQLYEQLNLASYLSDIDLTLWCFGKIQDKSKNNFYKDIEVYYVEYDLGDQEYKWKLTDWFYRKHILTPGVVKKIQKKVNDELLRTQDLEVRLKYINCYTIRVYVVPKSTIIAGWSGFVDINKRIKELNTSLVKLRLRPKK